MLIKLCFVGNGLQLCWAGVGGWHGKVSFLTRKEGGIGKIRPYHVCWKVTTLHL